MTVDAKDFEIVVQSQRCKACGICVTFCPQQVLLVGENAIPSVTLQSSCSGCTMCEYRCPDLAITVKKGGSRV
jgi:2-oxoglutarate ferredoxin oxidoreductase subunit delta